MFARLLHALPLSWRRALGMASAIAGGWTLIAVAWTPPSIMVTLSEHGDARWPYVLANVYLLFVPWMLATPALLGLGRRFPVAEGAIARNLAIHVAVGIVAVPLLTVLGILLATLLVLPKSAMNLAVVLNSATITGLYCIPTYIAVVGIGQALAHLERYRQREHMLAQAQLQALQAQINPHFLFNALNAISALGYKDPARADRALTELSALLRLALKDGAQEIALRDEIAFVRNCIDVYAVLRPVACTFDIDAEAWDAMLPRMILQPLIENALVHGIARRESGGDILLSARAADGRLTVSIENDLPDTLPASQGEGIGLANVRERLRVVYGTAQQMHFTPDAGGRARVTLAVPLRREAGP